MWAHGLEYGSTTLLHGVSHLWERALWGCQGNPDRLMRGPGNTRGWPFITRPFHPWVFPMQVVHSPNAGKQNSKAEGNRVKGESRKDVKEVKLLR